MWFPIISLFFFQSRNWIHYWMYLVPHHLPLLLLV
jgi:hypothetical protein